MLAESPPYRIIPTKPTPWRQPLHSIVDRPWPDSRGSRVCSTPDGLLSVATINFGLSASIHVRAARAENMSAGCGVARSAHKDPKHAHLRRAAPHRRGIVRTVAVRAHWIAEPQNRLAIAPYDSLRGVDDPHGRVDSSSTKCRHH